MKHLILLLITANLYCQSNYHKITISLKDFNCNFRDDLKNDALVSFDLMSAVFSSKQFQDSIAVLNMSKFLCNNICDDSKCNIAIDNSDLLNKLFSNEHTTWSLIIKKKSGKLGSTIPFSDETTAYYKNINSDMCNLPFHIGLAVNLCHEYIHHIGYCHPKDPKDYEFRRPRNSNKCNDEKYDPKSYQDDIAYRIGWIAYDIVLEWYKKGIIK